MTKSVKGSNRYIVKLGLTLFIITAITGALLAGVNELTKEARAGRELDAFGLALQALVPDGELLEEMTHTAESFTAHILERSNGDLAYCIEVAPNGYGGPINMIVGIEVAHDGDRIEKRVIGVAIISMTETPGVGTKVNDEAFLSQFNGIVYPVVNEDGTLNTEPSAIKISSADTGIDAISGATVTSKAIVKGVNTALNAIKVSTTGEVSFE